jgi:hypothetical protein
MRRPATIIMITAALLATAATSAGATTHRPAPIWKPYRTQPFLEHGVCSFDVKGVAVYDKEEVATLATFPDGSPEREEYRGPLYIRYTNVSTGKSIVRDQSGKAWVDIRSDKTQVWRVYDGHVGVGVKQGTVGFPAGEWLLHGDFRLTFNPTGTVKFDLIHATAVNLCHTLA